MKQQLLNELNRMEGDIVYINCTNLGTVPHIIRGPRFNVPLRKNQVASLITMGYKIEIIQPKKEEVITPQKTVEVAINEENLVEETKQEITIEKEPATEESTVLNRGEAEVYVDEAPFIETEEPIVEVKDVEQESNSEEVLHKNTLEGNLEGLSKTKLKKLLKDNNISYENSDSIEVLKDKASGLI